VHTAEEVWQWVRHVVIPNLYPEADYRGVPLADGGSRVVASMAAYRLGPVRLRQHRVISGKKEQLLRFAEGRFVVLRFKYISPPETC
jgi:glycerate kinase